MTQIEQQLSSIQQQLKKYAQELGHLNLTNNQLMESNQYLSSEIVNLNNKINKKKHSIEQENKDKQIIHQKLVKAEKIKEQIQIAKSSDNAHRQKERRARLEQQRLKQQLEHAKEQERIKKEQLLKESQQKKYVQSIKPQQIAKKQIIKHQQPIKEPKIIENIPPITKKEEKEVKIEVNPPNSTLYNNTQKGEYQPPALFLDDDQDDEDEDDEDNQKTLQILRSRLKLQQKQLHDNEDDD